MKSRMQKTRQVFLQEELCTNPPYEELLKVTEELDAVNKHKDALYEEWEQLEELTQLED